jgi:nitroreductase
MNVSQAVESRVSCRGFKKEPVEQHILEEIFAKAQQSPSNCNVQPWKVLVVSGKQKDALKNKLIQNVMQQQKPGPDFNWEIAYKDEHRDRQFGAANALYSAMDIGREEKQKRQMAMLRNWSFFEAPHVAIFTMDKYLDIMGAVDIGIYAQTLTLLLKEQGISSCMQGALGQFPKPIHEMFELPEERGVLFGMSFGYADEDAAVNRARTDRAELGDAITFA